MLVISSWSMMERHTWKAAAGMDTLGIEPRASRMLSRCETATPCAHESRPHFKIFYNARH